MGRFLPAAGLLAAALIVCSGGADAESGSEPRLTGSHPCPGASGFTCSTLTVPLDHRGRIHGILDLQVAAGNAVGAPRGVLLVITGGPGQPGVPFLPRLEHALGRVLTQYRVVVYDKDLAAVVRAQHDGALLFDALVLLSIIDPTYRLAFDVPAVLHVAAGGEVHPLESLLSSMHASEAIPAE